MKEIQVYCDQCGRNCAFDVNDERTVVYVTSIRENRKDHRMTVFHYCHNCYQSMVADFISRHPGADL